MRILYIAGLFRKKSCSASIRNVALINGLCELGCDVDVLTVKFPEEVLDPFLKSIVNENVNIVEVDAGRISNYIPSIYNEGKNVHKRYFSFIRNIIKSIVYFPGIDKDWIKSIVPERFNGYDLIISSSDTKTSHFVAARIVKRHSTKWLQIWGDPWADDVGLKNTVVKYRASLAEKKLLYMADYIGYVSLPTANNMAEKFMDLEDKIKFIPRSYLKCVSKSTVPGSVYRIAYTGILNGRDIKPILDALEEHNNGSEVRVVLDVYGRLSDVQRVLIETCKYAQYHGEVSLERVYEIFESSNALLYIGNASGSTQIPGKLYDYFGTELPILALVQDLSDDITKFILESKRCIVFENKSNNILLYELLDFSKKVPIMQQYSPESIAFSVLDVVNFD